MKHSKTEIALLTISVVFIVVMLIVPLESVLTNSLAEGWDFYVQALTTPYVLSALRLTLIATVAAVIVNTIVGLGAAWAISKFDFRGKHFLTTLIDIPFSISPVIAGLAFIMTFGRMGWIGQWIEVLNDYWGTDIQIVFAVPGVILATIFVTFPFVFREIIPVLSTNGRDEEEAAALMGASGWTIFFRITLPQIKWALLTGIVSARRPGHARGRYHQCLVETARRDFYAAPGNRRPLSIGVGRCHYGGLCRIVTARLISHHRPAAPDFPRSQGR